VDSGDEKPREDELQGRANDPGNKPLSERYAPVFLIFSTEQHVLYVVQFI